MWDQRSELSIGWNEPVSTLSVYKAQLTCVSCRNPCPYSAPGGNNRDAFKGKQLTVPAPKEGKLPSMFFEKEHPYLGKVK